MRAENNRYETARDVQMNGVARIDGVCDRERLVDLSYSLYECLSDLITDTEALTYANDDDIEGLAERVTLSSMNCLADMRMLAPMFDALVRLRDIG